MGPDGSGDCRRNRTPFLHGRHPHTRPPGGAGRVSGVDRACGLPARPARGRHRRRWGRRRPTVGRSRERRSRPARRVAAANEWTWAGCRAELRRERGARNHPPVHRRRLPCRFAVAAEPLRADPKRPDDRGGRPHRQSARRQPLVDGESAGDRPRLCLLQRRSGSGHVPREQQPCGARRRLPRARRLRRALSDG